MRHLSDLPIDLCCEHLLGFFNEHQLLQLRFVSPLFAEWVWFYFVNRKSEFSVHVGTTNYRFVKAVNNFLVHLKNVKKIEFINYDSVELLSLTGRFQKKAIRVDLCRCW